MLDSTTAHGLIKPRMPVVCSCNVQLAMVDDLEGRDFKVHVDRPGDLAMPEWTTTPPAEA